MEKYYVHGCRSNGEEGEEIERCEDSEAQFWTLYARDSEGLSEGIIDCVFREDAVAAMAVYVERDRLNEQVRALAAENAALKSGIGFFSYGTDSGYEEHATADDAIKAADSDIDYYRGDACDGWSDETDRTVWGVVIQRASMIGLHTETDDSGNKREICDYALLPVVETPATDAILREVGARAVTGAASHLLALSGTSGDTSLSDAAQSVQIYANSIRAGEVQP